MRFAGRFEPRGYPNDAFNNDVVAQRLVHELAATFRASGIRRDDELSDDDMRRRNGLKPKPRMKQIDDPAVRENSYLTYDADWITFDETTCTATDQMSIAPGYLEREWTENGRRCFQYKMDKPILDFYATLSARYAVTRDGAQRRQAGDLPHSRARVRAAVDAPGVEGRARLLRQELLAVSLSAVPDHRVPALSGIRAGIPEHDPVLRGRSASCIAKRKATTRSTRRTS